jgi:transaldolase/glucose-6-phosphate isomerase
MTGATVPATGLRLPAELEAAVTAEIARAIREHWAERLWQRDASLWTSDPAVASLIGQRLGWLDVPAHFTDDIEELTAFAAGIRAEDFAGAVVCGMGGSSLAPDVLARTMSPGVGGLPVHVLDSTDPAAVRAAQAAFDPARTLYLIASKSGTTTETLSFLAHFWQVEDDLHADIPAMRAGQHFAAITDPGRSLEAIPHSDIFREVFLNPTDVGGRYSALTYVGLVPAALMGLDLRTMLADGRQMAQRCQVGEATNPGLWLGAALAALGRAGRDKLTFVIEPAFAPFAAWVEQLIAESTGKGGAGLVPVVGEPLGKPAVYGEDRVFIRLASRQAGNWTRASSAALDALVDAGQPVIDIELGDGAGLGAEFFRWEFATAIAGVGLHLNPFDEPNVTESKHNTANVLEQYRRRHALPTVEALLRQPPLTLYADTVRRLTGEPGTLVHELAAHLGRARPLGYLAVQAYIAPTAERDAALAAIQQLLRDRTRRATTIGYGPRFLHSTGQLHKGGPPLGCFLQLTAGHSADLAIPHAHESFGTLIDAQALGDFDALEAHDLPVLRVDLADDPDAGLAALRAALDEALGQAHTS